MKAIIKKSNYWMIYDFANHRNRPEMQGIKLQALFKLIEKKGVLIQTNESKLFGLKALQISECEHIAIRRTAINETFYPCKLQTFLLTNLKP